MGTGKGALKHRSILGLIAGLGLSLMATGLAHAADPGGARVPALTAAQLVPTLHRINRMEIDAGKMAQVLGNSQAMRDYGDRLQRDHAAADGRLASYAQRAGIDLGGQIPPAVTRDLDHAHARMNELGRLTGEAFDRQFAQQMVGDHRKAIAIVDRSRPKIRDPRLRGLLAALEPTLRAHEQIAETLLRVHRGVSSTEAPGTVVTSHARVAPLVAGRCERWPQPPRWSLNTPPLRAGGRGVPSPWPQG